jgi:hypothetical protein
LGVGQERRVAYNDWCKLIGLKRRGSDTVGAEARNQSSGESA